jgi:CxxC-x17-CxxC domain-containing protein
MNFQDKTLECSYYGSTFTFSAEGQEQFQSRGHTNEPKRYPECPQVRKAERYGNSGNSYGNGSYGYTPQRQLFPTVCADYGKETKVPFEPSQGRPVYCSDCYR